MLQLKDFLMHVFIVKGPGLKIEVVSYKKQNACISIHPANHLNSLNLSHLSGYESLKVAILIISCLDRMGTLFLSEITDLKFVCKYLIGKK